MSSNHFVALAVVHSSTFAINSLSSAISHASLSTFSSIFCTSTHAAGRPPPASASADPGSAPVSGVSSPQREPEREHGADGGATLLSVGAFGSSAQPARAGPRGGRAGRLPTTAAATGAVRGGGG
eukprot:COSAG01_NODE_752_length_13837_cov_76.381670_8_plen_125_part_00